VNFIGNEKLAFMMPAITSKSMPPDVLLIACITVSSSSLQS
jgi:hypothetical protein